MHKVAELKIKLKSLAEESRIIRQDENKYLKLYKTTGKSNFERDFQSLRTHRIKDVGSESRKAGLVRGFLKGLPRNKIENSYNEGKWLDTTHYFKGVSIQALHDMIHRFWRGSSNSGPKPNFVEVSDWITKGNLIYTSKGLEVAN